MTSAVSQVVRTAGSKADTARTAEAESRSLYVEGEVVADKYKLVRELAEGGMGSLWVARNIALDALVALKLIRGDVTRESAEERFLTEARAAARLKHPSIVRVFDFGRTRKNEPFIVMELLHGESLGQVLDRENRVPATYAVQVLLPIVDALAAAHARDVIHRDLKPDNVFLAESDGRMVPKVLDFGIAKLQKSPVTGHRITQAGTVVGSPDYLSPEQARGLEDIDHRADIWALCVLLYECITGRVPFQDANYNALLRHIIEDDVPPISRFAAGDADLWTILQKGFKKQREERYQTMRELGEDLAAWLMARGITEDVTGHSLRAGWIDGGQSIAGRISRPSLPGFRDSTPATPMAPLRAIGAATEELASLPPPPKRRGVVILAGIVAALAALSVVLHLLTARTPSVAAPSARSSTSPAAKLPVESAPAPPAEQALPSSAAAPASARPPTRPAVRLAKPSPTAAQSSRPGASPSPAPAPTAKPKGAYGEDLGF